MSDGYDRYGGVFGVKMEPGWNRGGTSFWGKEGTMKGVAKADDVLLKGWEGKDVRVVFVDGKVLSGRLLSVGTYTLLLGREGVEVLVYKSALKYVHRSD
jgi:sRNA-binding regulator protein Hfq